MTHEVELHGCIPLGQLRVTPGIISTVEYHEVFSALQRHARGDWGDVPAEDKQSNNEALELGERLFSAYRTTEGTRFWVITECDRSVTTVLFPEEY